VQQHRRVQVLSDGCHREPADLIDGGAPEDRAGSAIEAGVVDVPARLGDVVEHVLFVRDVLATAETVLEQIRVVEVMRRLHLRDLVVTEVPQRLVQEAAYRHVIGIEGDDEVAARLPERVIEIPCFCALVVVARDVIHAELAAERCNFAPRPSSSK
jgi:hypothetical protein